MNKRENLISLLRRQGYDEIPVLMNFSPFIERVFKEKMGENAEYYDYFNDPTRNVSDGYLKENDTERFLGYFNPLLQNVVYISPWGVAHELGSDKSSHLTGMRHPLQHTKTVDDIKRFPFPDYENADYSHQKPEVDAIHEQGLCAVGNMQCTIWETAWYMRSMEELMVDMLDEDEKAECLLDMVTDRAVKRAIEFTKAGVDILFLGDDIGSQRGNLMSNELYCKWLKPRLKRVIDAAKSINNELIVIYHSCGHVVNFIDDLIEAGIDVLNPVQPECMDFAGIHKKYGDRLSFMGTIGTQTTMPFGSPEDVQNEVIKNLDIAGQKGGLWICPTHVVEPEVPWENVIAYSEACKNYKKGN